jgi:Fe-S cluster assembly protein SufD
MKFENLNENTIKGISQNEPEWVWNERLNALKQFNEIQDYNFKYGMTMKTDISDININDFKSKSNLVIKNKDDSVIIKELKKAFIEDELLLKNLFMKNIKSKLGLLNKSLVQEGLFIYVPKNTHITETLILELEFLRNSFDYILIIVDKNSSINIFEKLISNTKVFRNNIVDVYVNENSKVNFFSLQDLNEESYNFSTKRSFTSKNALCDFYNFDFGSLLNYNDLWNILCR